MAYISEFRALYHHLNEQKSASTLGYFLEKWREENVSLVESLSHHRRFDAGFDFDEDELASWYALSRVRDWMLMALCQAHKYPVLRENEYSKFWEILGFENFYPTVFHPFWCEIVGVETDENPDYAPQVVELLWPSLNFGEMLFSRAGVRVRSGSHFMDAKIATTSPLYFSYLRPHRQTVDLSMGWGSNSQWSTDFRRDYVCGEQFLFNVDAMPYFKRQPFLKTESWRHMKRHFFLSEKGAGCELSPEEREELLVNRCFVRSHKNAKDAHDYWPYDDCFVIRRDAPLC